MSARRTRGVEFPGFDTGTIGERAIDPFPNCGGYLEASPRASRFESLDGAYLPELAISPDFSRSWRKAAWCWV
jgi:hypothetical protein